MNKITLITILGLLISSIAFAAKPVSNAKTHLVQNWVSSSPSDVVTIGNPSALYQIVIVSVDGNVGMTPGGSINVTCNGKILVVKPYSGLTCRTTTDVTLSATGNLSGGSWEVEFIK